MHTSVSAVLNCRGKRLHDLARLFAPVLIFSLALPVMAGAATTADKVADGSIALSEYRVSLADAKVFCLQQGGRLPRMNNSDVMSWDSWEQSEQSSTAVIDGFGSRGAPWDEVGLPSDAYWTGSEITAFDQRLLIIVYDDNGKIGIGPFEQDAEMSVICVDTLVAPLTEEARRAKEAGARKVETERKAEEARKAVAAREADGFIALSETTMNWDDAKAFCQQKGGKLPRINNSDSGVMDDGTREAHVDGFGAEGTPWPASLPSDHYWTGTENKTNRYPIAVSDIGGKVRAGVAYQKHNHARVACVPQ